MQAISFCCTLAVLLTVATQLDGEIACQNWINKIIQTKLLLKRMH